VVCLSRAAEVAFSGRLQEWLNRIPQNGTLFIGRHHDPTPGRMSFGLLQGVLEDAASYLIPDPDRPGMMKKVDWTVFRQHFPHCKVDSGILELMAQGVMLSARMEGGREEQRRLLIKPMVLRSANSSCTHSAVESAVPELSLEGLRELAGRLRAIVLAEVPDNSKANKRKLAFMCEEVPKNVLITPHGCAVHHIQRCMSNSFDMDQAVGDIHACWKVMNHPSHAQVLARTASRIVDDELIVIPGLPSPEVSRHMKNIVQHTILRTLDQVRGSLVILPLPPDDYLERGEQDDSVQGDSIEVNGVRFNNRRYAAALIMRYLNGDPRAEVLSHHCAGCCRDLQEAKDNVKASILQGGLVKGHSTTEPSKARWGSTTESNADQCAGVILSAVLPRCMAQGFPSWQSGDDEASDDPRKVIRAKTWRAKCHLNSSEHRVQFAIISWTSEPVDHLWLKLQHLDMQGALVKDLQHPSLNPFRECELQLAKFVVRPFDQTTLGTLHWRFCRSEQEGIAFSGTVREHVLSMRCQMKWRFDILYGTWPFPLTVTIDERFTDAVKADMRQRFEDEPGCRLDPNFGAKVCGCNFDAACWLDAGTAHCSFHFHIIVKNTATSERFELPCIGINGLTSAAHFQEAQELGEGLEEAIRLFAIHTKLCNMHCERDLALIKSSCPGKKPLLEKICATGLLTQVLREHLRAGGTDPRCEDKASDLVAAGVPLIRASSKRSRKSCPSRSRGVFSYLAFHTPAGLGKEELARARSRLAAEFYALSLPEQAAWQNAELQDCDERRNVDSGITPSERYDLNIQQHLWGMSSRSQPVTEAVVDEVLQRHQDVAHRGDQAPSIRCINIVLLLLWPSGLATTIDSTRASMLGCPKD